MRKLSKFQGDKFQAEKMFPDILVAENDRCKFYRNQMTDGIMDWASEWGFKDLRCILAEQKSDQSRNYILLKGQEVVFEHKKAEDVAVHIDIMALAEGKKREDMY